ncbi:aryl-alcohol-oxidase from pleurotus Eryingii, partial [Artomyces pyxidatus]
LFLVSCLPGALATVYTNPSQLPSRQYDYVVVGAGPGGSVVANRLSAEATNMVLLIEAGPTNDVLPAVHIPFLCTTLIPETAVTWNYTTVPLPGLNNRSIPYPRGRVLGGSSSINYMAWTRGPQSDFDRYAAVASDTGWSWNAVKSLAKSIEDMVPPADGHNTSGQILPSIHGISGPVKFSVQGYPSDLDSRVFATTKELPEFPYNEDQNSGNPLGIGWGQYAIAGGTRTSAATAYLAPILSRPNFDVLVNTQVTKLVQTGSEGGVPIFRGVQFAASPTGEVHELRVTGEIIVSAGAVNTPQLLLLSGIGPATHLKALGIDPIVDLPDVGQNLQDHPMVPNVFAVNSTSTWDNLSRNASLSTADLAQWEANRTGLFASSPALEMGWLRLPSNATIFQTESDPSSGPHSPHYEFFFEETFLSFVMPAPVTGNYMLIASNVITPTSRGSITLASKNPFDSPVIDPALLNSAFDIFAVREAMKAVRR